MSNPKLKPCPFCGGKPRYGQQMNEQYRWLKWVTCTVCYACTGRSESRAEVTRAWNKRVDDPDETAALRRRLAYLEREVERYKICELGEML